jgi:hypothetical protein
MDEVSMDRSNRIADCILKMHLAFIRTHDKTFPVVAMRVNDPN